MVGYEIFERVECVERLLIFGGAIATFVECFAKWSDLFGAIDQDGHSVGADVTRDSICKVFVALFLGTRLTLVPQVVEVVLDRVALHIANEHRHADEGESDTAQSDAARSLTGEPCEGFTERGAPRI